MIREQNLGRESVTIAKTIKSNRSRQLTATNSKRMFKATIRTIMLNLTMMNGTIPNKWKLVKVIPIFKYGERTDLNNYRPISISPILS